jgi:glutamate dehydrogenase
VIEMVNDDMPFLVDSVTIEVNRQGYTLHLLNHPIFAARRDKEGTCSRIRRRARTSPRSRSSTSRSTARSIRTA